MIGYLPVDDRDAIDRRLAAAFAQPVPPKDWPPAGTSPVRDLIPGLTSGLPVPAYPLALEPEGLLLFTATTGTGGVELWRTDGTASNTVQVADVAPWLFQCRSYCAACLQSQQRMLVQRPFP